MNEYYDNNVINGANPSFIWCQLAEYFTRMAKTMRHEYSRSNRTNKIITWTDLDVLNKRIRKDLDVIYAGTTNVSDNVPSTNENKRYNTTDNMKKTIRLTESDLHRVIKESVNRILNEIGDTRRGQYMLGRLRNRQSFRGINYNDAGDYAYEANRNSYGKDYQEGFHDEEKYRRNADSTWDIGKYGKIKFNYDAKQMADMDDLGKKFIGFIEKHDGGVLLQTIVDYESGNQTGKKESPLKELIPYFEEEVLGYECTPDMIKAITKAYNQWWYYAEGLLCDGY